MSGAGRPSNVEATGDRLAVQITLRLIRGSGFQPPAQLGPTDNTRKTLERLVINAFRLGVLLGRACFP